MKGAELIFYCQMAISRRSFSLLYFILFSKLLRVKIAKKSEHDVYYTKLIGCLIQKNVNKLVQSILWMTMAFLYHASIEAKGLGCKKQYLNYEFD